MSETSLTQETPPTTSPTPSLDAELLRACRTGQAGAWEQIFETYERLVFSVPMKYGLPREEAADIVQSTFITLLSHMDTLRDDSNLAAWLCTVARRKTWLVIRKSRVNAPDEFIEEVVDHSAALFEKDKKSDLEQWELANWIQQGMIQLGEPCRALLIALYLGDSDESYQNVAKKLGMPLGSIGPRRARCLAKLKEILKN